MITHSFKLPTGLRIVIPAKAGIQYAVNEYWPPAFALGDTEDCTKKVAK